MTSIIQAIHDIKNTIKTMPDDKKLVAIDSTLELIKKIFDEIGILQEVAQNYETVVYPEITAQLAAAEKRTEKGIDQILTACESLPKSVASASDDVKKAVQDKVNVIFEASNFQDLTAQHLNEVKLRLEKVKQAMSLVQDILNGDPAQIDIRIARYRHMERSDAHLLNGPVTDVL